MFNTHLPSERRKLFLFILFVFLIVGFGTKYLLIQLGWVSKSSVTAMPEQQFENKRYNKTEIAQIKLKVVSFMNNYDLFDPKNKKQRLQKLKQLSTDFLYQTLERESNESRPVKGEERGHLQKINKVSCEQVDNHIRCLVSTILENSYKTRMEQIYELIFTNEAKNWVVEEVKVLGSFD